MKDLSTINVRDELSSIFDHCVLSGDTSTTGVRDSTRTRVSGLKRVNVFRGSRSLIKTV